MKALKSKFLFVLIVFAAGIKVGWADQARPLSLGPFEVLPSGEERFVVGAGGFNTFRQRDPEGDGASAVLNLEYHFGKKIYYLGFAIGGLVNSDGGSFVYLGNYADIRYKTYVVTPLVSVGAYRRGAGPDLGGTLQFRSSITLAYETKDSSRVGVRVAHTSNAGIYDENPGANEVLITYGSSF